MVPLEPPSAELAAHAPTGWDNLVAIATRADNVPILAMIALFGFFTALALRQAWQHDQLIRQGRKKDVLEQMRK